ncbi:MAG: hypothetical protein AABY07_01920, partial [Nanoarchaeota archaeon]
MSEKMKDKPLYQAKGAIWVGESLLNSVQASWPLGKIEVYKDKLTLQVNFAKKTSFKNLRGYMSRGKYTKVPNKIVLSYTDITGYKSKRIPLFSSAIVFLHKNK